MSQQIIKTEQGVRDLLKHYANKPLLQFEEVVAFCMGLINHAQLELFSLYVIAHDGNFFTNHIFTSEETAIAVLIGVRSENPHEHYEVVPLHNFLYKGTFTDPSVETLKGLETILIEFTGETGVSEGAVETLKRLTAELKAYRIAAEPKF